MKKRKNLLIATSIILMIVLFPGCTNTAAPSNQNPTLSVEINERTNAYVDLFGLISIDIEMNAAIPVKALIIETKTNRARFELFGKSEIKVKDYFIDNQTEKIIIWLLDADEKIIEKKEFKRSPSSQRPSFSDFNEGLYFNENGIVTFYQLEYLAGLSFDDRVALYHKTQQQGIKTYVALKRDGEVRYCYYSAYPLEADDPTMETFPYDKVLEVETGDYFDPKDPEVVFYKMVVNPNPPESGVVIDDGFYREGEAITLSATPLEDYLFDHWETNGGTLTDQASSKTLFSMPAMNVEATAVFVEEYQPWFLNASVYFLFEVDLFDLTVYEFNLITNPEANVASLEFDTIPADTILPEPQILEVIEGNAYTNSLRLDSNASHILIYAKDNSDHNIGEPQEIDLDETYAFDIQRWDTVILPFFYLKKSTIEIQIKSEQITKLIFSPDTGTTYTVDVKGLTEYATELFFQEDTVTVELTAKDDGDNQLGNVYIETGM